VPNASSTPAPVSAAIVRVIGVGVSRRASIITPSCRRAAEQPVRHNSKCDDHDGKGDDLRIGRANECGDKRFDQPVEKSGEHDPGRGCNAAKNRDCKGLDAEQGAHVRVDAEQWRDQKSCKTRERRRECKRECNRDPHIDAHQARGILVLHDGEQGLANLRTMECNRQRNRDTKPDQRNDQLQRKHAGTEEQNRLLREDRGKSARLLAEREQHDVVGDDTDSDRGHQPGIRSLLCKWPYADQFHDNTIDAAQQQRSNRSQR
jgi:hypothetical protein